MNSQRGANPPLPTQARQTAGALRRDMTEVERALWLRLRAGRLDGLKFRRQHPLPPYVVDFYCHAAALVVELDGSQHNDHVDAMRVAAIQRMGMVLLRFWNNDVLEQTDAVVAEIARVARQRTLTRRCAPPSPEGRGKHC